MQTAIWPPTESATPLAVLVSGGLDSAILVGEAVRVYPAVHPIYIRAGSAWEGIEFEHLSRFLRKIATPTLKPVKVLHLPVDDLYGDHWSLTGQNVPDARSADDAVFLPGRNVLLLAKALIYCHLQGIPEIAMAPLETNPFPDATESFFSSFTKSVNEAVNGRVRLIRPYQTLLKTDVVRRGAGMPLEESFSCIHPINGLHCGRCNKCAERQQAFAAVGAIDPTTYAVS
jgi:7-cyano-7-deazaguanine synthase